jgi:methylglutaconyl-CoA hydratase
MADAVLIERDGPLARVWLNRPEAHNALAPELASALVATLAHLATDASCRVVVLGGRGASFCAGADIGAMKASANAAFETNLAEAQRLAAMFAAVADFPKPVVARLHGGVYGGGVGFCCACDLAIAADDAKFGLTEVRLGILPAIISPYVVRRLGDRQAMRVGLVHHVAPMTGLDAKVDERVSELLKGAPLAQGRIKKLLAEYASTPWTEYRDRVPRVLAEMRSGDEAKDGLAAFFEKRKPKWVK